MVTVPQPLRPTEPTVPPARPVRIRLLGAFSVQRGDGAVVDIGDWRTGRARDLVRMLALSDDAPVPAGVLTAALWPSADPVRARASLRTAASEARKVLGGAHIERTLAGLRLRHAWVDVTRFRTLAEEAHRCLSGGRLAEAHAAARDAVALYRGEFRAHDRTADWAQDAARGLAARAVDVADDAAQATLALGMTTDAIDFARRALEWDAFDERAYRTLMRAYAASGQLSAAMLTFQTCRTVLADELGIDPSPQTQALHLDLLCGRTAPDTPPTPAPPPPGPAVAADLSTASVEDLLVRVRDVHLPRREFAAVRRLTDEVARRTTDPMARGRALVLSVVPDVLLGNGSATGEALFRAHGLARAAVRTAADRRIDTLELLIAHDNDTSDFDGRWVDALNRCAVESDVTWRWVLIRISTERGALDVAAAAARSPLPAAAGPLARQLDALARAGLALATGRSAEAGRLLRALDCGRTGGATSLVAAEVIATLAGAVAVTEPDTARSLLARLDRLEADSAFRPRERYAQHLARAALRIAEGRPAAAAAAAAKAADIAQSAGLVWLDAAARRLCRRYLGEPDRAVSALASPTGPDRSPAGAVTATR